jgi:hypothetical protein
VSKIGVFTLGENEMSILCSLDADEAVASDKIKQKLGSLYSKFFSGGNDAVKRTIKKLQNKKLLNEKEPFKLTEYGFCQKRVLEVNVYLKRLHAKKK